VLKSKSKNIINCNF